MGSLLFTSNDKSLKKTQNRQKKKTNNKIQTYTYTHNNPQKPAKPPKQIINPQQKNPPKMVPEVICKWFKYPMLRFKCYTFL